MALEKINRKVKRANLRSYIKGDSRFFHGAGAEVRDMVECKCPACEIKHEKELYWTGKLPARIYCHHCERNFIHDERMYEIDEQTFALEVLKWAEE